MITDATSAQLRCPNCGRDVKSLQCGHCGSQLPAWQSDLYGAAVRQIAKLGGDRRADTGHARGNADEAGRSAVVLNERDEDPCDCSTPQWLFDRCNEIVQRYCRKPISRDVCAAEWNHKCKNYWTKQDNALTKKWEGVCWCNPPWSGDDLQNFLQKAILEAQRGTTSACLIPVIPKVDMQFLADHGRVHQVIGPVVFTRRNGRAFHANAGWATTSLIVVVFGPGILPGWGSPIKLGCGRRADTGHERGNVDESLAGERTAGESPGDDDQPRDIGGDIDDQHDRGTSQSEHHRELSISDRAAILRAGKQSPEHGIVYTPPHVAQFLFQLLSPCCPKIVLDVASGNGALSLPWRGMAKIIEFELGFGGDFFSSPEFIDTDLVVCNPPFGSEKKFLRRILKVVPETTPIVLFATHRVRLGSYASSADWRWCRDEWPAITSTVSLPRGVFPGVNETVEILLFRMPNVLPHYFLRARTDNTKTS